MTTRCRFIAIGDVHGEFGLLWEALAAAGCADADGLPTPPVCSGLYQVVLLGDLVHPKSRAAYTRLLQGNEVGIAALEHGGLGEEAAGSVQFSEKNKAHLKAAAEIQMLELRRLQAFQEAAPHALHLVLGNHDEVVLSPTRVLGTGAGLRHLEFDPSQGGVPLAPDVFRWMSGFAREVRVGGVQFAHVGPNPKHHIYDDTFYGDKTHRRWYLETPESVQAAGLELGVYGHSPMERGLLYHAGYRFALIDTLPKRQFLELMLDPKAPEHGELSVQSWRVVEF